jgi:glycosyltransferase involved in cell wall biosynthesis
MSITPKCSVVIPTYNRAALLGMTLDSLTRQSLSLEDFEVVIVDDGSTDETPSVIDSYRDRLRVASFYQEDLGWRAPQARNVGITHARGEICVFVDSGVLLHSECLTAHLASHGAAGAPAAVCGYVYGFSWSDEDADEMRACVSFEDPDQAVATMAAARRWPDIRDRFFYQVHGDDIGRLPAPWACFWTCNVSAVTAQVRAVGGFDETFTSWGGEDIDLGYRLHRAGASFALNRDAIAIHYPHEKDISKNKQDARPNWEYMARKYDTPITRLLTTEYPLAVNSVALARNLPTCAEYEAGRALANQGLCQPLSQERGLTQ